MFLRSVYFKVVAFHFKVSSYRHDMTELLEHSAEAASICDHVVGKGNCVELTDGKDFDDNLATDLQQAVVSNGDEYFTVACAASLRLMAVGIGRNKKVRERASKLALAVACEAMKRTVRSPSGCDDVGLDANCGGCDWPPPDFWALVTAARQLRSSAGPESGLRAAEDSKMR